MTYDVIVVGAGISGLVCAAYLAKAGLRVLVVEQHDKPGGYCTSFARKGFVFDAAAHSFGSYRTDGNFRKIVTELSVDELVKVVRFDPSDVVVLDHVKIDFKNSTEDTVHGLQKLFPQEEKNIRNYFDYFLGLAKGRQFENVKLKNKTFGAFLDDFFTDSTLKKALSFPVFGNGGLPPSMLHAFTGTRIFREFIMDGGYYTEGGMQSLPNALAAIILRYSGTVLYRKKVVKILCQNDKVEGVRLNSGEAFTAKYIVAACDMTQTLRELLGEGLVSGVVLDKVNTLKTSISTFTLYIGLDKPFKELPEPGTNMWYVPACDLEQMFDEINRSGPDTLGGGGIMLRVSPDARTLLAFCGAYFQERTYWKENKKRLADAFLGRVANLIPNLRSHIVYFDAATPYTQFRYTLNHQGANYGWAPSREQLFDPDLRQTTAIGGLYLTGHWTGLTHGIPGVAYLGHNAAISILKKEKIVLEKQPVGQARER